MGGGGNTAGSLEFSYNETAMILNALILNKASQPVAEISEWLRDHFSFAVPSLALADPRAGSWLAGPFWGGGSPVIACGAPTVTPWDLGALP